MTEREVGAMQIVNKYALYTGGVGLVPVPLFNIAAIAAIQVKMLSKLAHNYDVPLSEDKGKTAVTALLGSVVPTALGSGIVGTVMLQVPIVGSVLAAFTVSAFAAAATFAVGKVFIQHFESGGTFLDFDPSTVRAHFREELAAAQAV